MHVGLYTVNELRISLLISLIELSRALLTSHVFIFGGIP